MLECDSRQGMSAASAALPTGMAEARSLSAAALEAALAPSMPAYSPIVLAGVVRLLELAITVAIGFAIYAAYVVPVEGFEWHYVAAILAIAGMAMIALQAADVYQVQAFRGHEKNTCGSHRRGRSSSSWRSVLPSSPRRVTISRAYGWEASMSWGWWR
jgi:hypothetical protein